MPFRQKAKTLFSRSSKPNNNDTLSLTSTTSSAHEVYAPGESMPPPKYRRAPQKEHKDKLEAFSFADAWRKKSFQSTHSPGGTRASSRRTSFLSQGRKSRKSFVSPGETGEEDAMGWAHDGQGGAAIARPKDSVAGSAVGLKGTVADGEGAQEADATAGAEISPTTTTEKRQANGVANGLYPVTTAKDHHPFSEQDIASAMQRSPRVEISAPS